MSKSHAMVCGLVALMVCSVAIAQQAPVSLSIDAQPLDKALNAWARQTGYQVMISVERAAQGRTAPQVKGTYTPEEALRILLASSNLEYEFVSERTVAVRAPAESAPPLPARDGERKRKVEQAPRQPVDQTTHVEELGEIVVTAQKRSENIQDVPISISTVGAEQLRSSDASQLSDVAAAIPGLQLNSQTGQPGSVNVTLRGITTADITSTTTAITVDDVPIGSSTAYGYAALSNIDLLPYDLDHIEVLKGPQGTLYGASSLGGLVKYVTTTPDLHSTHSRIGGSVSSIDRSGKAAASGRVSVNAALIPGELAVSFGGGHSYRPGYIDNIATGEKGFNHGDQDNARLSALWKPNEVFTAKLTGLYNRSDFAGLGGITYDPATNQPVYGKYETFYQKPFRDEREASVFIADLSFDLGFATLSSVTGHSDIEGTVTYDASEIPFYKATFGPIGVLTPGEFTSQTKRLSQELRLASPDGQTLQWLVGAFYNRERTRYDEHLTAVFATTGEQDPTFTPFYDNDSPSRYEEKAAFGNLTYNLTEAWDIGGGARYSQNDQSVSANTTGYLVGGGGQSPVFRSSDHSTTWAVNSRYRINPDVMLYGRVATGYRPGGANTAAGVPPVFKPDKTTSYEVGVKSDLLDQRVHFNLTAFYIDWTNIQLTDRLPSQVPFTGNAGAATSQGIELSSGYRLTEQLRLGAVAAYTDAKLESDAAAVGATSGDRLPNTPKWSGLISLDWMRPLTDAYTTTASLAYRAVTSRECAFPFAQSGAAHLRSYDATDLTAGVITDRWRANIFVKNLTNEHAYLSYSNFAATILQPRTLGLSVDVNF